MGKKKGSHIEIKESGHAGRASGHAGMHEAQELLVPHYEDLVCI